MKCKKKCYCSTSCRLQGYLGWKSVTLIVVVPDDFVVVEFVWGIGVVVVPPALHAEISKTKNKLK